MNRTHSAGGPGFPPSPASFPMHPSHSCGAAPAQEEGSPPNYRLPSPFTWMPSMLLRVAAQPVCLLPVWRLFIPGLWLHHRFAVSFHIDFKFYYRLLEHSRARGFPTPSIRLFPVKGMSFAIFISWLVTSPSVCTGKYPWLAVGQVWETGLASPDICAAEMLCSKLS